MYNLYNMSTQDYFPIRELEAQTGVKSSTIRAWERRYGLIKPERTPKGHRLYSQEHIDVIERITELLGDGHSFKSIKRALQDGAKLSLEQDKQDDIWSNSIAKIRLAISEFSFNRVDNIYNDLTSVYPLDMVSEKLIEPLIDLYHVGETGTLDSESAFFNKWLQTRLSSRFYHDNTRSKQAKKVIFASSFHYETTLMLMSNMIIPQGYQSLFFGGLMDFNDLESVIEKSCAKAVFLMPEDLQMLQIIDQNLFQKINVPIFVFGKFSDELVKKMDQKPMVYLGNQKAIAVGLFKGHMANVYHD